MLFQKCPEMNPKAQAITWANVDTYLCQHMASLGDIKLMPFNCGCNLKCLTFIHNPLINITETLK